MRKGKIVFVAAIAVGVMLASATVALAASGSALWTSGGHDRENTRHAKTESKIDTENVFQLAPKWVFETGGDVSVTPAVDGRAVYFPDRAGNLFAVDKVTGESLWTGNVPAYTGIAGNFSRTTPAVYDGMLVLGDQGGRSLNGARVIAVDKETGELLWASNVETHQASIITQSPVVFRDTVYVGVSSVEEQLAADLSYPCCTFRGSVVALDVNTGEILWKTYTAPAEYSGNSVWGPTPAIDPKRGSVYVTTGNNHSVPPAVLECVVDNEGDPQAVAACSSPDNHFDSIISLDLMTGELKWATHSLPFDSWTAACLFGDNVNCPAPSGPAFDFGEGPALFTVGQGQNRRELLGAGQKSGRYWTLDPNTGEIVWVTQVGPGGALGGIIWGSAVDGQRIYVANANASRLNWVLASSESINYGFWSALNAATGETLWQTPDPEQSINQGPVTVANGVVFACSLDDEGHMYAMDAASGVILWSFASGGSCNAGAAVVNGTVYWGSGYQSSVLGSTGNNRFYAFEVPK